VLHFVLESARLKEVFRSLKQHKETCEGKTLTELTEITAAQKSMFEALVLKPPTPSYFAKIVLNSVL